VSFQRYGQSLLGTSGWGGRRGAAWEEEEWDQQVVMNNRLIQADRAGYKLAGCGQDLLASNGVEATTNGLQNYPRVGRQRYDGG
jgi:hypothetical protein